MNRKTKTLKAETKKMPVSKKLTKEQRHEIRRKEIIEAAKKCALEKGFHQASVDMIANETGINVGQLYRYYKNKEAIIEAIATDIFEKASKAAEKNGFFGLMESATSEHKALMHEIHSEAMRNPSICTIINERKMKIDEKLKEFVHRESPKMTKAEVSEAVDIISIIMGGIMIMTHKHKRISMEKALKTLKTVINALIPDLAKRSK